MVPISGHLALLGTGHEGELYRYLIPAIVGCTAGFLIGREHGRYIVKQKKLLESQELFRAITENTQVLICRFKPGYVITHVNESYCKYFGKTSEELIGSSFMSLIPETDREQVMVNISKMTVQKPDQSHDHHVFGSHGESRWMRWTNRAQFDVRGQVETYLSIGEDISERKEAEEMQRRLLTAIEQAGETFVITDAEGTIQYVNPAFEQITGYTREEAIGQNPCILQSGQHDRVFYENMWNKLLQGEVWRGHFVNKKKDGTLFEEDASISPIRNSVGKITNFIGVKRDVSQEKLLKQQLQQSQKMESIGTLAGGIAHDFNNILTSILGYAEIAKGRISTGRNAEKDIDKVIQGGLRAADLVKQILAFSRKGLQKLQPLNPYPVVEEALKMLRSTLPTTIAIETDIDPQCGNIVADPTQIHQVVMNLCTNAFHAMDDEKGTIKVTLQCTQITAAELSGEPDVAAGPYIELAVRDNGGGMDQQTMAHIFEPYFTTKGMGKGSGLGLAVIHGIVKKCHGFIRVVSEPGEGSSFQVYLPALQEESMAPEVPAKKVLLPTGTEQILVIDDESMIAKMNEIILGEQGYNVTAMTDSQKALELIRMHPDRFDLIVTDQSMPNLSGAELAQEVLKIKSTMPIILCTGYSSVVSEEQALAMGIKKYVIKPLDITTLAHVVRRVLDEG